MKVQIGPEHLSSVRCSRRHNFTTQTVVLLQTPGSETPKCTVQSNTVNQKVSLWHKSGAGSAKVASRLQRKKKEENFSFFKTTLRPVVLDVTFEIRILAKRFVVTSCQKALFVFVSVRDVDARKSTVNRRRFAGA